MKVPREVRHLHREPRYRLSTGTNDKNHAERIARDKTVPEIHQRLDALFDRLDPFVEGLRSILEREGVNVSQWYRDGKITHTITGEKTHASQTLGIKSIVDPDGAPVTVSEKWSANDYPKLCGVVTGLGYAGPNHLLNLLDEETRNTIRELSVPGPVSPKDAVKLIREHPDMTTEMEEHWLEIAGRDHTIVKIDDHSAFMFSDLADQYIADKQPRDSKDVHSKRQKACEMFLRVNGDKPINDYDKLHMIEMARFMDNDDTGRQWANVTIKNYVSYGKQAFDYAAFLRGPNGKVRLPHHTMHEFKLSEFGSKSRSYVPLSTDELMQLFRLEMDKESRLLLSILITTGMRLDEAALLTFERVSEYEGILCFSLVPDANSIEGLKIKNEQSMRYVPVPNIIKPLLGNFGSGRIFSYRIDPEGKSENAASKALMRYIRKVTDNPRKAVHSLRGNLKDLMRDAGVSKEINDFLSGHAQGDVAGGRYGDGPSMAVRRDTLDSIEHPWLQ